MSGVKTELVKEAIKMMRQAERGAVVSTSQVLETLELALKGTDHKIPKGCPVKAWNDGDAGVLETFYIEYMPDVSSSEPHRTFDGLFEHCNIDYRRKGHVIPWNEDVRSPCSQECRVIVRHHTGEEHHNDIEWTVALARHVKWHLVKEYVIWPDWNNA